jgi:hypothetical protein
MVCSIIKWCKRLELKLLKSEVFGTMILIRRLSSSRITQSWQQPWRKMIKICLKKLSKKKWKVRWTSKGKNRKKELNYLMLTLMIQRLKNWSRKKSRRRWLTKIIWLHRNNSLNSLVKFACFMLMSSSIRLLYKLLLTLELKLPLSLKNVQEDVESSIYLILDSLVWLKVLVLQESWVKYILLICILVDNYYNALSQYLRITRSIYYLD